MTSFSDRPCLIRIIQFKRQSVCLYLKEKKESTIGCILRIHVITFSLSFSEKNSSTNVTPFPGNINSPPTMQKHGGKAVCKQRNIHWFGSEAKWCWNLSFSQIQVFSLWRAEQAAYCTSGVSYVFCSVYLLHFLLPDRAVLTELCSHSELLSCYVWMWGVSHSPSQPLHYPRSLFVLALASSCLCIPPLGGSHPWADHKPHYFLS